MDSRSGAVDLQKCYTNVYENVENKTRKQTNKLKLQIDKNNYCGEKTNE